MSNSKPVSAVGFCVSLIPFIATFIGVGALLFRKIFPLISHPNEGNFTLPWNAPTSLQQKQAEHNLKSGRRRVEALTFSVTISLATVLVELILCEISNTLDPAARALALRTIVSTLLFFLVILIPFLELQSIISAAGWSFKRNDNGKISRMAWILQALGFTSWLCGFWWLGSGIPGSHIYTVTPQSGTWLTAACLERIGIIGIASMALLSGFASVSAAWQTFGPKSKPVSEADVIRKQSGLDATHELLASKRSRLRALKRKTKDASPERFMTKVAGAFRGSTDTQEISVLELEISGLVYMASSLSASLSLFQNRLAYSRRASSPFGKVFLAPASYGFSIYCIYRIITTVLTNIRRIIFPSPSSTVFAAPSTDPINRVLSLFAKHVDPSLNQLAWSRQISFLLSGIILLASFNSVLTTFHMLTKFSPSFLHQAQANLALLIAQISATYVISSALLLRSNLPSEMKSVVSKALGNPLEPSFVERWFDGWFLLASFCTLIGIWVGRRFFAQNDWDGVEFDGDIELGQKRS
ncbi:hypothetical protein K3495_g1481 [Podosphaera aphanis]|nr:hypothetical protein K3495_g1481 [Podosphaera aphanis]